MSDKKLKVVITDYDHPSMEIEKTILSEIDPELILAHCNTEDEVIKTAKDADGIINQYAPITRRVLESLKRCKVIARYGVGVDNIDVEAATEYGIIIANVPDYCVDEVSTHTMALILACARGITLLDRKTRDKNGISLWLNPSSELKVKLWVFLAWEELLKKWPKKLQDLVLKL